MLTGEDNDIRNLCDSIFHCRVCVQDAIDPVAWKRISFSYFWLLCSLLLCKCSAAIALEVPVAHPFPSTTVKVVGNRFIHGDRELILNGINYFPAYFPPIMPSSWLDAGHYRPEIVEDELASIQQLGINLVSITGLNAGVSPTEQDCSNVRDFLARAQAHGLLVNLYIGSGSQVPIANPKSLAIIPKACGLSGHPALFAYDVAWEPHFGDEIQRLKLQPRWLSWLEAGYGSLSNADVAFGDGHAQPSDTELCGEGPSVKVAAFRRFLDDVLSANYQEVRSAIHAVDTTHLIGVRSGWGGNGSRWPNICGQVPVDLRSGAKHLDFISPESYALPPADKAGLLNRGGFTAAYADVGKPVYWAEFGISADNSCAKCTETIQASFMADMFDLIHQTASNGGAAWWYVGARSQSPADRESSDDGIIYDYMKFPTASDAFGDAFRDGELAVCAKSARDLTLHESSNFGMVVNNVCPMGLKFLGGFAAAQRTSSSQVGVPQDGAAGSGWLTLCGVDDRAVLLALRDEHTDAAVSCPNGYHPAGAFKPCAPQNQSAPSAIDAHGKSISSGWITLCSKVNDVLLKRVRNEMSSRTMTCPSGLIKVGSFKPDSLAVFRPAAQKFNNALSGVSATQRNYVSYVTVDRDAAAGDWRMYDSGTQAYATAAAKGQRVGVRTACSGSTSKEVKLCVGNTPFNGSCPAKCLNAEWNSVQVLDAGGVWQTVSDKGSVAVAANMPIHARLSVGNTGVGKWLSRLSTRDSKGAVRFGCQENAGDIGCRHDLDADVVMFGDSTSGDFVISRGISHKSNVVFQMVSVGVAWFGDRLHVSLLPQ